MAGEMKSASAVRGATQAAIVAATAVAFSIVGVPTAQAEQFVRTESGRVRCEVEPNRIGCQDLQGFSQAPVDPPLRCPPPPGTYLRCGVSNGVHWDIASVTSGGVFGWQEGNLATGGSASPANDVVLTYGQTYNLQGWTINPSEDGTRFTNNATSHGMFVSINNVYSF
jgi:hypothetical protein